MDHPPQPHEHSVRLFRDETLGSGSYGVVCKAMWGQCLCAAKLLHPIFFQSNDPGMVTTRRKFEQECRFLNDMKHPHIVEYLGTSHDPDSGLLVLLMELMDESLTDLLKRSQQPLAYHIEVDLCHDIAQAIAYIHCKEIIHRDLSGNNVLLLAGRAKITDFGMSKLLDVNRRMTPLTMCPGNSVYMPPEALREPPAYSKKIDCFSFGVLQIQIMTRQFPDPGPPKRVVEDSRSPTGTMEMPVLDSERRQAHIDLIDPAHPLLPTALCCLSYLEKDRPSAQELCQQLATLEETPYYTQSKQQAQLREQNEDQTQLIHQLQQQLQTLQQELQTKDQQLQDSKTHMLTLQEELQTKDQQLQDSQRRILSLQEEFQTKSQQLQDSQRRMLTLHQELQTKDQQLQDSKTHMLTLQEELQTKDQQLQDSKTHMLTLQEELQTKDQQLQDSKTHMLTLQEELQTKDQQLQDSKTHMLTLQGELQTKDKQPHNSQKHVLSLQEELQTKDQQLQDSSRQIQQLRQQVEEKQLMIDNREIQLQSNEEVTAEFQRNLLHYEQVNKQLQETVGTLRQDLQQVMEEKQAGERRLHQQLQTQGGAQSQKCVKAQKTVRDMSWQKQSKAPEKMRRGSAASDSNMAYFNGDDSTRIHSYDSNTQTWCPLPPTPHIYFTLVVVQHILTMVGGYLRPGEATNSLLSLKGKGRDQKWLSHLPAMPTKRYWTAVIYSGHFLIVTGGYNGCNKLDTVEVLDTDTLQWSIASSLTHPFYLATISICGERLYMLGGNDQSSRTRSVLTCSIPELLQSCQPQPLAGKLQQTAQSTVWRRLADAPHYLSSCATLCEQLVAVGGRDEDDHDSGAITIYNESSDSWEAVGDMPTARRYALVAILNGKMMVVGGRVGGLWVADWTATDIVEMLC